MQLTAEQQQLVEIHYDFAMKGAHALVRPTRAYDRRWADSDTASVAHESLCEAVRSFRPDRGATLRTWIGCVLRMRISNAVRSHKRRYAPERLLTIDDVATYDATPQFEIDDFLSVLYPRDREIFRRHVLDDETMADIGKVLGVSRQRIQQIVLKCKERLARELGCSHWLDSATTRVKRSTTNRTLPQVRTAATVPAS